MIRSRKISKPSVQVTKASAVSSLPVAAYDELISFAKSYVGRRGGPRESSQSEGERCAELVQIIFNITKGDVRVKLGVLANTLGIRQRRLSDAFRRLYGVNPKEFQLQIRIDWVCDIIFQNPDRKIDSIAAEVGYTDPSDFNHIFRKRTGLSPRAYQKRAKIASRIDTF